MKNNYIKKSTFVICIVIVMILSIVLSLGAFFLIVGTGFENDYQKQNHEIKTKTNDLAKQTNSKKSIEQVVNENENAVVEIKTESISTDSLILDYVKEGAGSGIIIDKKGFILTCNHVVEHSQKIIVTLKNGQSYKANVVGKDSKTDLAVLKIIGDNFAPAKIGNSDNLSVGSLSIAIGNPLGKLGGSASAGIISALDREIQVGNAKMRLLQTDASINPGNSGGGLFNDKGELIGVVVAKSGGENIEGIGFAIPINKAYDISKNLIKNGKVKGRAAIGISIVDVNTNELVKQYNVKVTGVYVVESVSKNANKAGFEKGDLIYSINGSKIKNSGDLFAVLEKHKVGDKIKVVVVRDNKKMTLETILGEAQ